MNNSHVARRIALALPVAVAVAVIVALVRYA